MDRIPVHNAIVIPTVYDPSVVSVADKKIHKTQQRSTTRKASSSIAPVPAISRQSTADNEQVNDLYYAALDSMIVLKDPCREKYLHLLSMLLKEEQQQHSINIDNHDNNHDEDDELQEELQSLSLEPSQTDNRCIISGIYTGGAQPKIESVPSLRHQKH